MAEIQWLNDLFQFHRKRRIINAKLVDDIRLSQEAPQRNLDFPVGVSQSAGGRLDETELRHDLIM